MGYLGGTARVVQDQRVLRDKPRLIDEWLPATARRGVIYCFFRREIQDNSNDKIGVSSFSIYFNAPQNFISDIINFSVISFMQFRYFMSLNEVKIFHRH